MKLATSKPARALGADQLRRALEAAFLAAADNTTALSWMDLRVRLSELENRRECLRIRIGIAERQRINGKTKRPFLPEERAARIARLHVRLERIESAIRRYREHVRLVLRTRALTRASADSYRCAAGCAACRDSK